MGILLGMRRSTLSAISMENQIDPEQCCNNVIIKWLEDSSPHYSLTWEGVCELLEDIGETESINVTDLITFIIFPLNFLYFMISLFVWKLYMSLDTCLISCYVVAMLHLYVHAV